MTMMLESLCIQRIEDNGAVFIEWMEPYKGTETRVKIVAHCGHEHIVKAVGPVYCYNSYTICKACRYKKSNISEAERISQINEIDGIQFVSWQGEYTPKHSATMFANIRCNLCNNISQYRIDSIVTKGCKCKHCHDKRIGGYNETIFERDSSLKNIDGTLYVLHIFSDTENFYKVGISARGKARIEWDLTKHYSVEVIDEIQMPLYDAFLLEQNTIRTNESYIPKNKFAGHTECLVSMPIISRE